LATILVGKLKRKEKTEVVRLEKSALVYVGGTVRKVLRQVKLGERMKKGNGLVGKKREILGKSPELWETVVPIYQKTKTEM